ncbi:MAG: Gldg family protein [Bacteroidetes bacterium]|nr:Gldg family protein [Bacteroidota bacterium]
MLNKKNIASQLLILIGIVVLVNLISDRLFFRLDFTADKRYTLSEATKDILSELNDVVTITAYFSEDLPPQLIKSRKDFEDLLTEYENRSNGNVLYEFINPNESEAREQETQQNGIGPIMVNVTERDQVKQLRAYMGALIQLGDQQEIIPLIRPGGAMEYSLTTAIKKISITNKPKVAFLQGHGEPGINASFEVQQQLSVLYDLEPYTIQETQAIPITYRALAIIDPKDTIPPEHFAKLDKYLQLGGGIFIAFSSVKGDLNSSLLSKGDQIGIVKWLRPKGVVMTEQFVVDVNSANITVRQQQGPFIINSQVRFPYFPLIGKFADHPITKGLESLLLPFANSITLGQVDSTIQIQALAFTSNQSGLISTPSYVDINKQWTERDFNQSAQITAVALEGLGGSPESKMVVVANARFAVNGDQGQQQQLNSDNVNFATNAIDWLSDDTGLIDLRTKGITSRPLDQLEDGTKSMVKYGNVVVPIILILIYGLVRRQRNQMKRQKWMQESFE